MLLCKVMPVGILLQRFIRSARAADIQCYTQSEALTPYRIAASSISMFISFSVLNLMQYPLTLALPIFPPYV